MRGETVILAAGDFPRPGGEARRLLDAAVRVVCCDGAATTYRRETGREPAAVVGDLDSYQGAPDAPGVVRIAEQETNDLAKAVRWCAAQGWRDPVIVGATGLREDHTIGNVFRALDLGLEIVTDYGRFVPVAERLELTAEPGAPVSIFAPDPSTRMTSEGLDWPLDGVRFTNLYCATLNRTTTGRIVLTTTRPALVFIGSLRPSARTCR